MAGRKKQTRRKSAQLPIDPLLLAKLIRRREFGLVLLVLLVVVVLAFIDHGSDVLPVDDDWHLYHGQRFEVARVVDGDTLDLNVPDRENDKPTTRIRLWGVDTPEVSRSASKAGEPWSEEATDYTRDRVEGQWVTVYLQDHRLRGRYGRLLAYIELPDGGELGAELIEEGLSEHDDRWSHGRADTYEGLEQNAKRGGRGMWSD